MLTTLLKCRARIRKFDKDDVTEALLSIVRDGHRADTGLIVKLDQLVVRCVSFCWPQGEPAARRLTRDKIGKDSLMIVRLRGSEMGMGRMARWTRSALVKLEAYRSECMVKWVTIVVGRGKTSLRD